MASSRRIAALVATLLPLAAACSSSGSSSNGPAGASSSGQRRRETVNSVLNLTEMLSGRWEGSTPGNRLNAVVSGAGSASTGDASDLSVIVTGKYQDSNVWEQGLLHLDNQGTSVWLAYIPRFQPSAAAGLRFSREELDSACSFYVGPRGDGYAGETRGTAWCARAIRGAIGKWSFEVEPGSIRLRSAETGETLRFRRAGK